MSETHNDGSNGSAAAGSGPKKDTIFCPSAQPGLSQSMVFGIVDKGQTGECISYLKQPVEVTDGTILAFVGGSLQPTQLFRFAAPCEKSGCNNWSGSACRVGQRLVQILPAVVNELPDCILRPNCRWFRQEGPPVCLRCPQVVTDDPDFESALTQDRVTGIEDIYPVSSLGTRSEYD